MSLPRHLAIAGNAIGPTIDFTFQTATASRSRRASSREFYWQRPSSDDRGHRECRALGAPAASYAKVKSTRVSPLQVDRNNPAFPARMVLTVSFALSSAIGLVCHRCRRKFVSTNLMSASRHRDHATSPSAFRAVRRRHVASTASPLYVRDDRETPLLESRDDSLYCCFYQAVKEISETWKSCAASGTCGGRDRPAPLAARPDNRHLRDYPLTRDDAHMTRSTRSTHSKHRFNVTVLARGYRSHREAQQNRSAW
jgi:hypothetical protein